MLDVVDVRLKMSKSCFEPKNVTTGRMMMRRQYENTVRNTLKSLLLFCSAS